MSVSSSSSISSLIFGVDNLYEVVILANTVGVASRYLAITKSFPSLLSATTDLLWIYRRSYYGFNFHIKCLLAILIFSFMKFPFFKPRFFFNSRNFTVLAYRSMGHLKQIFECGIKWWLRSYMVNLFFQNLYFC